MAGTHIRNILPFSGRHPGTKTKNQPAIDVIDREDLLPINLAVWILSRGLISPLYSTVLGTVGILFLVLELISIVRHSNTQWAHHCDTVVDSNCLFFQFLLTVSISLLIERAKQHLFQKSLAGSDCLLDRLKHTTKTPKTSFRISTWKSHSPQWRVEGRGSYSWPIFFFLVSLIHP